MFDSIWKIAQKNILTANTTWAEAMRRREEVDALIRASAVELQNTVSILDEVLKQCVGKPGKFTPITDGDTITGLTIAYEVGGLPVSKTLMVDFAALSIPECELGPCELPSDTAPQSSPSETQSLPDGTEPV